MGGLKFYEDESGNKYVVGADSVPKKLGSETTLSLKLSNVGDLFDNSGNTFIDISSIEGYQNLVLFQNLFCIVKATHFYNPEWTTSSATKCTYSYNNEFGKIYIYSGHGWLRYLKWDVYAP